jgi:DNA-binding XRE family transcriptional regulator
MSDEIEAVYRSIGARIQMIRETLGLTQEELAQKLGYTRTSIIDIETGKLRVQQAQFEEIARLLASIPRNRVKGLRL